MTNTFWIWLGIIVYAVMGLAIAVMARRQMGKGITEFFLANRTMGGFVSALTYSATTYSAFMMIGLAGLTYLNGVGALGFEMTYLVGTFMLVFFLPRYWLVGHKYGYISPTELLSDRYQNRAVGLVAAVIDLIFLVPYSAIQLLGVGILVNGISGGAIPVLAGILIAALLTLAWTNIAGLRSVAWTDAFQALIMIAVAAVVLAVVIASLGGFGAFFQKLETAVPGLLTVPNNKGAWNINMFIGLSLPWFFFVLSNPQVSQRLFIPKSVTAMKRMVGGFMVFGFIYTLISVLWGFSAILLVPGLKNPDAATPTLLSLPIIPVALSIIVMVGIIAAAITTIDSILLTLASMWACDVYGKCISPEATEERRLRVGQWVVPVMVVVAFIFAWWASGKTGLTFMIAPLSSAASAGLLMVVPSIIGAFFWKRGTAAGAIVSNVVGSIIVLYFQISGKRPMGWWPGTWGFVICVPLFIIVSLLTRAPKEKAEEFMGYLKEKLKEGNFF